MSFAGSPRLVKGGIVLLDSSSGLVLRIIALQYNPETVSRSLSARVAGQEQADRSQALRLKAPPVETIKVEVEIDATDQLEHPDLFPDAPTVGLHPQLAALESLLSPTSAQLSANEAKAASGTLEIVPMEAPLAVFVWSANRIVPVRVTELSVTEEAFDAALNPTRAKVELSMRVLSVEDLGFAHRGGNLFMAQLRRKEGLADRAAKGAFGTLGISGLT